MSVDVLYLTWNRLEYTKASWAMLMENTDWALVDRLVVHDDGSSDGTRQFLEQQIRNTKPPASHVEIEFEVEVTGSPPAVMNRYVAKHDSEWFAKVDNDIIVPPGWLGNMLSVLDQNPDVELLGMEAGRGNARHEDWDGIYRFEPGSHMGGVGLIHTPTLVRRPLMSEDTGRYGWTEWQHEYTPVRGWINPDLPVVQLDRIPFDPWRSLADDYVNAEWSRPWGKYHDRSDYWDWWPDWMKEGLHAEA